MKKIIRILTALIAASMLIALVSCNAERKLKDGETYAFSENGLYSFVYVREDYNLVNLSGAEAMFIIGDTVIQVMSIENSSAEGLDDICATLPHYENYSGLFEGFDFSNYTTVKLNKMKNVRFYEIRKEVEDADRVMQPATSLIYIFAGDNAYYLITAGYMDHEKDEAVKNIHKLIDTFEERKLD